MRSLTAVAALGLTLLHGVSGFNSALTRKLDVLAQLGLSPEDALDEVFFTSRRTSTSSKVAQAGPPAPPEQEAIVAEYVDLPIDNFARNGDFSEEGTFGNRYWVRTEAYEPGGPVFLYDAGEGGAANFATRVLQQEDQFFKQMVDRFGGIGIVWEHRYYGDSIPGGFINLDSAPEQFRFLTTEQALADVDRFAKQFSRPNINYTLTPDATPWVFVGASYPGMRAAFMRDRYPDTIFASFASSAPVEARIDMSSYFEPVARGLKQYGFGNCSNDIHAATLYIDQLLASESTAASLKTKFLGKGGAKNSNPTFADALLTFAALWQSYGVDGGPTGLRAFCDWIETDPSTNGVAPAEGWAKTLGPSFTVDRWASFPQLMAEIQMYLDTTCSGDPNVDAECDLDKRYTSPDAISWTWQYCTQWGFFQTANFGPNQIVSKYNNLGHQHDVCHRQFPTAKAPLFPEWPLVQQTNAVFGGWDIRPSQTYWSGGEFDPWRTLSTLSSEPFAPHPKAFPGIPECGQEQDDDYIFGYVMKNAQHGYDFRTAAAFPEGAISREYWYAALTKWLKCFRPKDA